MSGRGRGSRAAGGWYNVMSSGRKRKVRGVGRSRYREMICVARVSCWGLGCSGFEVVSLVLLGFVGGDWPWWWCRSWGWLGFVGGLVRLGKLEQSGRLGRARDRALICGGDGGGAVGAGIFGMFRAGGGGSVIQHRVAGFISPVRRVGHEYWSKSDYLVESGRPIGESSPSGQPCQSPLDDSGCMSRLERVLAEGECHVGGCGKGTMSMGIYAADDPERGRFVAEAGRGAPGACSIVWIGNMHGRGESNKMA